MQAQYTGRGEDDYPVRLMDPKIKPPVTGLWYRGKLSSDIFDKTVAIVGSRKMSRYGKQVLAEIVPRFVSAGYTTISGFMYGIDTEVHSLTIDSGGRTVAVLGYGIDCNFDVENTNLYHKMMESGSLIMSEYPGKTSAQLWTFPQRNRIVVGLSDMVVVVEAGKRSGSLNSASWALRQGKPIFSVPGSIFSSTSEGSNILISEGKAISLTLERLNQALGSSEHTIYSEKGRINSQKSKLNASESTLVALMKVSGPSSANELARSAGRPVGEISACLMSLLLRGEVSEEKGTWRIC